MTGAFLDVVEVLSAQDVNGDCRPPGCMRGNQLPLRDIDRHDQAVGISFFYAYRAVKSNVSHQLMKVVVVVPDCSRVGSLVAVLLQYPVGSLRFDGETVYINHCEVAGLLLEDAEDIPIETAGVNPYHVRMPLE